MADDDAPLSFHRKAKRAFTIDSDDESSRSPLTPARTNVQAYTAVVKPATPAASGLNFSRPNNTPTVEPKESTAPGIIAVPVKKEKKPPVGSATKNKKITTSARKAGRWTDKEDAELASLFASEADGTGRDWARMAEQHSRGTSVTALKARWASLPAEFKQAGELAMSRRMRQRQGFLPLAINRYHRRRAAWFGRWRTIVCAERRDAAVVLQRAWRHVCTPRLAAASIIARRAQRWLRPRHAAATVAQRSYRAWAARRRAMREAAMRAVHARRVAAALRLQCAWRRVWRIRARSAIVSDPGHAKRVAAYARHLQKAVAGRRYELNEELSAEATVCSSRVIKQMSAWRGAWPALRELLQNTIDHLKLLGDDGRLHAALRIEHTTREVVSEHQLRFVCAHTTHDEVVCAITVRDDELTIEQAHTFPLHPRALDTGVVDQAKQATNAAGGFGDGFKTAAIALLAQGGGMEWIFEAEGQRIEWRFVGEHRRAVGAIAAGKVLNVHMRRDSLDAAGVEAGVLRGAAHRMVQHVRLKGVGAAFRGQAMRRLQVFWNRERQACLVAAPVASGKGKRSPSHAYIADASQQLPVPATDGQLPEPGVYVRGIWVQPAPISKTLVCFDGPSGVDVSGRDRNSVEEDDVRRGVMAILSTCDDTDYRWALLEPLMGIPETKPSSPGSAEADAEKASADSAVGDCNQAAGSWLLRSPEWLAQLLTEHAADFLHWLNVPDGAIFLAGGAIDNACSPWMKFAHTYLKSRGAPVLLLRPEANGVLFKEAREVDLRVLLVEHLLCEERELFNVKKKALGRCKPPSTEAKQLIERLLEYAKLPFFDVHAHPAAGLVPFAHRDMNGHDGKPHRPKLGAHVFLPQSVKLTKLVVVKVLNRLTPFVPARSRSCPESHERLQSLISAASNGAFEQAEALTHDSLDALLRLADRFRGIHDAHQEPEHEMGDLRLVAICPCGGGEPRDLFLSVDVDEVCFSEEPLAEELRVALADFDRGLAAVRRCTGATLSVFPAYAPSFDCYGVNIGQQYALINLAHPRPYKKIKWTIVHELAHQRGHGHDIEFVREFQALAALVDGEEVL